MPLKWNILEKFKSKNGIKIFWGMNFVSFLGGIHTRKYPESDRNWQFKNRKCPILTWLGRMVHNPNHPLSLQVEHQDVHKPKGFSFLDLIPNVPSKPEAIEVFCHQATFVLRHHNIRWWLENLKKIREINFFFKNSWNWKFKKKIVKLKIFTSTFFQLWSHPFHHFDNFWTTFWPSWDRFNFNCFS